uniref:RNase H type-1 domain-containing protein n=1 Tax=Cannabis sativa TaxID=3483 RepID=A0A803P8P2_CANSA
MYFVQWKKAQDVATIARFPTGMVGDGAESWVKPQENIIKVSIDATTFGENSTFEFGIVARDCHGYLVQARTVYYWGLVALDMAEVLAIKEALSWIKK